MGQKQAREVAAASATPACGLAAAHGMQHWLAKGRLQPAGDVWGAAASCQVASRAIGAAETHLLLTACSCSSKSLSGSAAVPHVKASLITQPCTHFGGQPERGGALCTEQSTAAALVIAKRLVLLAAAVPTMMPY